MGTATESDTAPLYLTVNWIWTTIDNDSYIRRAALSDRSFVRILGDLCFAVYHAPIPDAEVTMEAAIERFSLIQLAAFQAKRTTEAKGGF